VTGPADLMARCEACERVYELDDIRLVGAVEPVEDCRFCGGPLYLIDRDEVVDEGLDSEAVRAAFVEGWTEGWDACRRAVRAFVRAHRDEVDRVSDVVIAAAEAAR